MQIGRKASQSIRLSGRQPDLFTNIIEMAIRVLELLIMQIINLSKKFAEKADVVPMKPEIVPSIRQSERSKRSGKIIRGRSTG